MNNISKENLEKLEGGVSIWLGVAIVAAVIFVVGVVDGYVRPLKCNNWFITLEIKILEQEEKWEK